MARACVRLLYEIVTFFASSSIRALCLVHLNPLVWRTRVLSFPFAIAAVVVDLYAHPPASELNA